MAIIEHDNLDDTYDIDITCDICGKSVVGANWFGMHCEDKCEEKEFCNEETHD